MTTTDQKNLRLDPIPGEPLTELGYARRLVEVHRGQLRYVPAWKDWLVWNGSRWVIDETGQVHRWAKVIARNLTTAAYKIGPGEERKAAIKAAQRAESSAGINGVLALAQTEAGIAVHHEELDAHPFLLNCLNGTLDLRTGELREANPDDLLTKTTGAAYEPTAEGEQFKKFLETVQPDQTMRDYIARLLGHALEGRVIEHVLPIFYGDGANGKGTLINVVLRALGDYGDAADPDLLAARTFDAHPTSVADLFGRRLAVLHEGEQGRRLAEGLVKRLTGGDRIKARRMREDFWSFEPSHTFVILTNHKPIVTGQDGGIWRRLQMVPWSFVVPEEQRDEHLGDRLALEVNAVLAWLVAGYQSWCREGLNPPDTVLHATSEFRKSSDTIGRFVEERCLQSSVLRVQSSQLFNEWSRWCAQEGEDAGTAKAFAERLIQQGFTKTRTNIAAVWVGLALKAEG